MMKSDARKSALTNSSATRLRAIPRLISDCHASPARRSVSTHNRSRSRRSSGFSNTPIRCAHCASSWL